MSDFAHPAVPDPVLLAAAEQARVAAVEVAADSSAVGSHTGAAAEEAASGAVVTHFFAAALPGYVGWQWAVTLARAADDETVTVDEVVLVPGDQALLAPAWVPWHERLLPGDLSVGDVLPTTEDDARLVPVYLAGDDSADDPAGRVVAEELGFGRERVLSLEGRAEAAGRWLDGEFGPQSPMARHAPGRCTSCGFYLPLAGSLRTSFGACSNAYAPADGHVVPVDYGCGAHSSAGADRRIGADTPITLSARYDTAEFDRI